METLAEPHFWLGVAKITLINVVLSIDNAIVIALAARSLPVHQQAWAVACGTVAVVVMRIVLTLMVAALLAMPYLKLVGAVLVLWIAIQLLVPQSGQQHQTRRANSLVKAVGAIVLADLAMSVDNVLGVAAAAGDAALLVAGLALSIPLVVFGATLLMQLMAAWPVIITLGASVLGWVAGEMLITDPAWAAWIEAELPWAHMRVLDWTVSWAHVIGVAVVISVGRYRAMRVALRGSG